MLALITVSSRTKAIWLDTVNWSCGERGGLPAGCELWPALMNFKHFFIIYATFHFIFFIFFVFLCLLLVCCCLAQVQWLRCPRKAGNTIFHFACCDAKCFLLLRPISPLEQISTWASVGQVELVAHQLLLPRHNINCVVLLAVRRAK